MHFDRDTKMKILLLWPSFYPERKKTGAAGAIRGEAFAKYLRKEGAEVSVIVPEKKKGSTETIDYERCKVIRTKTYNTLRESYHFVFSLLYFPFSIFGLIRKVKKIKPNLVIASTPGPFLPIEGLLVSKILDIPFIFDMEDSWHLTRLSHEGAIRNNIKMYLERLCATHADMIFTVTPTLKRMIMEGYGITDSKINVVYNGVDLDQFPLVEKHEEVDLIHLGSPRIYYDTPRLIDAISIIADKLPDIRVKFVGCAEEDYANEVKEYVRKKGLTKNIVFVPPIPHERVVYELVRAKIGIISLIDRPEYKSAIGVKAFEYMAASLPIAYLGPSESEQEKLIMENSIGVCGSNPTDFAEKVVSLLNNKSAKDVMGANATEAIKKYVWEKMVKEAFEKYIKSLGSATRRNVEKKG